MTVFVETHHVCHMQHELDSSSAGAAKDMPKEMWSSFIEWRMPPPGNFHRLGGVGWDGCAD